MKESYNIKIAMFFETDTDFKLLDLKSVSDGFSLKHNGNGIYKFEFKFHNLNTDENVIEKFIQFLTDFPFKTNKDFLRLNTDAGIKSYIGDLKTKGLHSSNELIGGNWSLYFNITKSKLL